MLDGMLPVAVESRTVACQSETPVTRVHRDTRVLWLFGPPLRINQSAFVVTSLAAENRDSKSALDPDSDSERQLKLKLPVPFF